jgi:hypothetical protein
MLEFISGKYRCQLGQFQDGYYEVHDLCQDSDKDEFEGDDYNEISDVSAKKNSN